MEHNKPLEKMMYILLGIFLIGCIILFGIGYLCHINGINPIK